MKAKYTHEKRPKNSPRTIKIFFFVTYNLDRIMIYLTLNCKSDVNIGEKETVNNSGVGKIPQSNTAQDESDM